MVQVKSLFKVIIPIVIGALVANMDQVSAWVLAAVASSPRLAVIAGGVFAGVAYALKSPVVRAEIAKLEGTAPPAVQ